MAYARHTWADGDVISAQRLNNIEEGIGEAKAAGAGLPPGGTAGQVLTKKSEADRDAEWKNPPGAGVTSFNNRSGAVMPQRGDYTADMVGAFKAEAATAAGTKGLYWMEEVDRDGNVLDAYPSANTPIEAMDAVSDSQLATLGQVKTAAARKALDVYSTEEQGIGTWVDGRPLYRKTFVGTAPEKFEVGGSAIIQSGVPDIDDVHFFSGRALRNNLAFPITFYSAGDSYISVGLSLTSKNLIGYASTYFVLEYALVEIEITIEYTKTTDQPTVAVATVNDLNAAYAEGVQGA